MKRAKKRYLCSFCEGRLVEGEPFCRSCGNPTSWASHDEKVAWELEQYGRARTKTIDLAAMESEPVIVARPHPLARPSTARIVHPVRSPRQEAAVVNASEIPEPSQIRMPIPAADLPDPGDPAMLLKVVRVLNAKVSEMEARLAAIEAMRRRVAGNF